MPAPRQTVTHAVTAWRSATRIASDVKTMNSTSRKTKLSCGISSMPTSCSTWCVSDRVIGRWGSLNPSDQPFWNTTVQKVPIISPISV